MNKEDLNKVLKLHKNWLNNESNGVRADLSGADLSGAYLSGADLSGAYLSGADLSRAYLSEANLSKADLSKADLSKAYLSEADLSGAYLSGADLSGAYLSGAYLSGADLGKANFSRADLSRANLSGADLSNTSIKAFYLGRDFAFFHEGYLKIGCIGMPIEDWAGDFERIGRENGYTVKEIQLYGYMIQALIMECAEGGRK